MKKPVKKALEAYRLEQAAKKLGVRTTKKAPAKKKKAAKKTAKKATKKKKRAKRVAPHRGSHRCTSCGTYHTASQHWSHAEGPGGGAYARKRGTAPPRAKKATKKKKPTKKKPAPKRGSEREKFIAAQMRKGRSRKQAEATWRLRRSRK